MAKAKKLQSGNWRCLVYSHTEKILQQDGTYKNVRRYESITAPTKKEAELKASQFALNKTKPKVDKTTTLSQAIDLYIQRSDATLSPTTIQGYRKIQNNSFQSIMDEPISRLSNETLREAVNLECKRVSRRGKPVSPKTVSSSYGLICSVLKAYRPDLDRTCKLPQKQTRMVELLPPEIIFNIIKGTEIELPCMLAMWLSFSMSEIRGLTKSQSVSNGYITVKEVVVDINGTPTRKQTAKEPTRQRKLKIPQPIMELIDGLPKEQDELVALSGQAIYKRWARLLEKNNLPHMSFHDLRHVNASVMAMLRIPDKYAQERGGWKTDKVMKTVYQQTFSEERERVDTIIDEYFSNKMQHEMQHE